MERLKHIKSTLESLVETQLGDIEHTNAKELGEVVDMIKDLEETMYYCAIVQAMEKGEDKHINHYPHGEYNWNDKEWNSHYENEKPMSGEEKKMVSDKLTMKMDK